MNKKSGLSMLMLIITIVVLIILMSAITLKISIASGRENLSVLVNNVSVIEEYIASCNVLKEELPFSETLTAAQVKALIDEDNVVDFQNELTNNGDSSTTSFKKIDMKRAGIKKTFTGYEKQGENDIYVYSESTGTVYYLLGVEYDGRVYFSVNNNVTNIVK